MLAKWCGCKTNIHWIKELTERWGNLTWGGDLLTLSNVSTTKAKHKLKHRLNKGEFWFKVNTTRLKPPLGRDKHAE